MDSTERFAQTTALNAMLVAPRRTLEVAQQQRIERTEIDSAELLDQATRVLHTSPPRKPIRRSWAGEDVERLASTLRDACLVIDRTASS